MVQMLQSPAGRLGTPETVPPHGVFSFDPTKIQRLTQVEGILVEYQQWKDLIALVDHARLYSKFSAEPECVFIGGAAGAGKTTFQRYYRSSLTGTVVEGRVTLPVLRAKVQAKSTEKRLVTDLLRGIGDPLAESGSADSQRARLLKFMNDYQVEIVALDEFQHFLDKDDAKVLRNICDWLKALIEDSRRPFLLCGMPWAVQILDDPMNEQLSRRITVREEIKPFGWDTEEAQKQFRKFLKAIELKLDLPQRSHLGGWDTSYRFYCATNGRVGKVMKLFRRAAELAILENLPRLDLQLLARAYKERLLADQPGRINPFVADVSGLKPVPFEEYAPDFGKTNRRSKAKEQKHTAAGALRA